jgi:hypothetical protein
MIPKIGSLTVERMASITKPACRGPDVVYYQSGDLYPPVQADKSKGYSSYRSGGFGGVYHQYDG